MSSFHRLLFWISQSQKSKSFHPISPPTVHIHTRACTLQYQTHIHSSESDHNSYEIIMAHLQSCISLPQLDQIHAQMIRSHMLLVGPDPIQFHWNCIMRSYVRLCLPCTGLRVYVHMSRAGVPPDSYTLPIVLKAVGHLFAIEVGWQLHSATIRRGLESNEFCETGLISMYAKAGEFESAFKVFEQNPERKLGSWNAIIGGFAQAGHSKEAVRLFVDLRKCGFEPDDVTMVSVASACGSLGDLSLALQIHKCVFPARRWAKSDVLMSNSVIDMYGKCGRTDLAHKVFSKMVQRDVSTWTSMIMGLAMHGHVRASLDCFGRMRVAGIRPNHVTFVGVLSACVHGGLVDEGRHYFDMMTRDYGITPMLQHYGCMVDLLGRAGLLGEARLMVEMMPMRANSVIWGCLLGACEKHGSVEMGEWVARKLVELEPWNDGVYVVLSNIYAGARMWEEVERVRCLMKERKVAKTPGYSLATLSVGPR
ncbi:pentatricopeptide repeat-containing protein At1g77170, mitochondrial [Magnolia sinica]|uniref:pentatricopeptide repeat-containing protein At1g77170, mitochondrial n=1 Tax=Magnolia sinica TaxID=86752 RepID=UPI002658B07A|nr:pentatricopeptide repeat-containing protein At1g77170, mitochondrial [Magnolia sinica]